MLMHFRVITKMDRTSVLMITFVETEEVNKFQSIVFCLVPSAQTTAQT